MHSTLDVFRPRSWPISQTQVRTYGLALVAVVAAVAVTRFTWPLFARTPFALLFGAVFVAARWGSESAGLIAVLLAAVGSVVAAPPPAQNSFDDRSVAVFVGVSLVANRIVSDRNRAQAALRASEAQFRASWEHSAIGAALLDRHGQVERINPALERILGYPGEAWTGMSFAYFSPPDNASAERKRFGDLMSGTDEYYQREQQHRRRDGNTMWGRVTLSVIRGSGGKPTGALMMLEDITARRQAEEEVRASEEHFRSLFDGVPIGLFQVAPNGHIAAVNRALLGILGYDSVDSLRVERLRKIFADPAQQERLRAELETRGAIRGVEVVLRRTGGEHVTVLVSARTVPGVNGVTAYYEGSVVDLTDRRALEAQLLQAQKLEALGRAVSGVAHDFNNLLTGILGYTEMLLSQIGPDKPIWQDLQEVHRLGERGASLTQQLLAFSRQQVLRVSVVDLNSVVTQVEPLLRTLLDKDIRIDVRVASDIRAVRADGFQLERVLLNLALNARDAMPSGGLLVIETAVRQLAQPEHTSDAPAPPGEYVTLTVRDTGVGMDEHTRAHLFEPFFTTKEPGKGTGLGLSSVHGIVKQNSGYIAVQSEPGGGSEFTLFFPATDDAIAPAATDATPAGATVGSELVVVVEDDRAVRAFASAALRRHGYRVLEASGEEALGLANPVLDEVALVLTDVMPRTMPGPDLVARLRTRGRHFKVLYTSGYPNDAFARRLKEDATVDWLQKPFTATQLLRTIRSLLDTSISNGTSRRS